MTTTPRPITKVRGADEVTPIAAAEMVADLVPDVGSTSPENAVQVVTVERAGNAPHWSLPRLLAAAYDQPRQQVWCTCPLRGDQNKESFPSK